MSGPDGTAYKQIRDVLLNTYHFTGNVGVTATLKLLPILFRRSVELRGFARAEWPSRLKGEKR